MGLVVFEINTRGQRTTKNLNRELLWYQWAKKDAQGNVIEEGKLHKLNGGRLDFKYDFRESKLDVGTAPVKITSYETESNEKAINAWAEANRVEYKLSVAKGVGITVTFPDDRKKDIKKALEDTNFTYEII